MPLFQQLGLQVFQQDIARPHTTHATVQFLQERNIALMPFLSLSPDLTPIKHAWDQLSRRESRKQAPPTLLLELRRVLTDKWNQLPQHVLQNLVNSIHSCCNAALLQTVVTLTIETCTEWL